MEEFFKWLSNNSVATITLIASVAALIVSTILIYVIAFLQGREISFWPPKIGEKVDKDKHGFILPTKPIPLTSGFASHVEFNLDELLKKSHSVDLLGYNLLGLLHDMRESIANAVSSGAYVRILMIDPTCSSYDLMRKYSNWPDLLLPDAVKSLKILQSIQELIERKNQHIDRLEIRLTTWIPSCNVIIVNAKDESGVAKIGINSISFRQPTTGRVGLILTRREYQYEFDYFAKSFQNLWDDKNNVDWDGTIPKIFGSENAT